MSIDEVIKYYEFSYKVLHLLFSDGDFGCYGYLMGLICLNLATWYSILSNAIPAKAEEALFYLNAMAEHYVKSVEYLDNYNSGGEFKHTSLMVNRLNDPEHNLKDYGRKRIARLIKELEDESNESMKAFDNIRTDGRYMAAVEKLKTLS